MGDKRAGVEIKSAIRFELILSERVKPGDPQDIDGYYQGGVRIVKCDARPSLVGKLIDMNNKLMASCAPYFIYEVAYGAHLSTEHRRPRLLVNRKDGYSTPVALKSVLGPTDVSYMEAEIASRCKVDDHYQLVQKCKAAIAEANQAASLPMDQITQITFSFSTPDHPVYKHSDLVRLPHMVAALAAHVKPRAIEDDDQDGDDGITYDRHSTCTLRRLSDLVHKSPWELVFFKPHCAELGVWPLTVREHYQQALGRVAKSHRDALALPMRLAVNIYLEIIVQRERLKDTVFPVAPMRTTIPCLPRPQREALEREIFDGILTQRGLVWVVPETRQHLALERDMHMDSVIHGELCGIIRRASTAPEPVLRGRSVPQAMLDLTPRQREIAEHITRNAVTVVQGPPGTGKTQVLTWVVSHYRNVLCTGFVAMLVKMLRHRNGNRDEIAHTIHHFITKMSMSKAVAVAWFEQVEVLVVDECSNISSELFHRLLPLFPNICKLVIMGDQEQLKPIEAGDPLADMTSAFGKQALSENLRVAPELVDLQNAITYINSGTPERIRFSPGGPITMIVRSADATTTLQRIFEEVRRLKYGHSILNTHLLVLKHDSDDGRHALNSAAEAAYSNIGVINRRNTVTVRPGVELYVGCKVRFSRNYNRAKTYRIQRRLGYKMQSRTIRSDPVQNGEVLLVTEVTRVVGGIVLRGVDTEDPDIRRETKTVWIGATKKKKKNGEPNGVEARHVGLGYGSTVYSSQGREYPYIIFWVVANPSDNWTRPNAYVAASRGKKRVWIVVSHPSDFFRICHRKDRQRQTALGHLMQHTPLDTAPHTHYVPGPMQNAADLRVMDKAIKCAPVPIQPTADNGAGKEEEEEEEDSNDE